MPTITKISVAAVRNELRRHKAAQYLRARGIHRADLNCGHRYEPHNPDAMRDHAVIVTVCRVPSATVNHAVRA